MFSLISGLGMFAYGAYQKGKAKKAYNSIADAPYDISQLYRDNVGLAQSQAQTGFSPETTNYFTQQLQQGLASSSSAMLQAGGGVNDFSKAYQNYTTGLKSFSLENDKLKMSKIQELMKANESLAREETQQWAINKYKKMQDQKAAAALMLSDANNMMNNGLNTAIQGGAQLGQYYMLDRVPKTEDATDTGESKGAAQTSAGQSNWQSTEDYNRQLIKDGYQYDAKNKMYRYNTWEHPENTQINNW